MTVTTRTITKALLACVALVSLQACAPVAGKEYDAVTQAYNTSGVLAVDPYTRTIFSTHNF